MVPLPEDNQEHLIEAFKTRFGALPALMVRCPGRVNLIGEHIDYSGYSVLPMAIKMSTFVLARKNNTNTIRLVNTNSATYPDYEHDASIPWEGSKAPRWYHYFLCGWKGGVQELISSNHTPKTLGIDILVDGSVPPNAGLSSSSSVVCAALLTTLGIDLHLDTTRIDRRGIADLAARVEHYIGVEGGGMDQAIECLAEKGHALRIDFNPLRSTKLVLPQEAVFAVLHSGATMNKGATAYYNQRVVECRIAAQIIAKRLSHCNWREIRTLKHLAEFLSKDADEMIPVIDRHFEDDIVSREEVLQELETTDEDLIEYSLNDSTADMKQFHLRSRPMHVFTEAQRVYDFQNACEARDLAVMGKLMNESHESCRDLFDCSCPELDTTVAACREAGCIGARLTGAGWGGCVVALVEADKKDEVASKLNVLFWSEPAAGISLTYL